MEEKIKELFTWFHAVKESVSIIFFHIISCVLRKGFSVLYVGLPPSAADSAAQGGRPTYKTSAAMRENGLSVSYYRTDQLFS